MAERDTAQARFVNQNHGDRYIPAEAVVLEGEEDDTNVWTWQEGDATEVFHLQQGYDLIVLSRDGIKALAQRAGLL